MVQQVNRKAFTLIELLVVVAIIGILAAVGVVAYNGYTASAKKTVSEQNHKMMVKQFTTLIVEYDLNGSINKKVNGGAIKNFTKKSSDFDCQSFQHHFKDIKTPYADSAARAREQDNQAWAGTCCNYGKEGRTYIWEKAGGYCTFSTYVNSTKLVYDEAKWSD
jgi:prepilin-type N-terminal cleavage/methylation domain-containing protein